MGGLPQGRCQLGGGEGHHGSSSEVSVIKPTKLYCYLNLACTEKHQLVQASCIVDKSGCLLKNMIVKVVINIFTFAGVMKIQVLHFVWCLIMLAH